MKRFLPIIIVCAVFSTALQALAYPKRNQAIAFKKGIYLNAFRAGDKKYMKRILTKFDGLINTLVIDVKDSHGKLSYNSKLKIVRKIGSQGNLVKNLEHYIAGLKSDGYYLIARIAVFRDPVFARYKARKYGVKIKGTKKLFRDENGFVWVDPFSKDAWNYNTQIAEEVAEAGFDEIQFDYVRFPSSDGSSSPYFPFQKNRPKEEAIHSFLLFAHNVLEKQGINISIATFGYTAWHNRLPREGQHLYRIGSEVDVISPMLYPSHFADDFLSNNVKEERTYNIVFQNLQRAKVFLRHSNCKLLPYIQGFNWKISKLGKNYIGVQMKACEDAGVSGWIVWNAKGEYDDTYEALINHSIRIIAPDTNLKINEIVSLREKNEKKHKKPDLRGIKAILHI